MNDEKLKIMLDNYEATLCFEMFHKLLLSCAVSLYAATPKIICEGFSTIITDDNRKYLCGDLAALSAVIQYMGNKGFIDQEFLLEVTEKTYKNCAKLIRDNVEAKRKELMKENEQSDNG